ncbi:DUF1566 domain-containing protein [Pseudoalteromonas sp. McH1-7]|uniref:Lcl C-terminal domain-containing protein n=1 Tax=Pseudoalteromonas peptidolytica F12-50-A1 TaxID=1315280 RepID=A0A8I0MTM7_9GAMM|nr:MULTISPECIES: DUF1566 domain-containing protein [Pseudoalteromonas]MBE0345622.1 hypothetical protein [Pseudoalteromonas peptidolytica F12-50-A1]MDW7547710.1 DUF1566 domain-containing protein [Pseudoalteromonas peptidolytica]NLR13556.1 DUF1566 domain-containing protein [Pseudoalteromonas peptidolytica]NUZ11286.1 DUF1566 domain-containing protein [Pseudoalteromonas sp. McH1-7]RRS06954.1 DUF1566 domain-containing protein [Pseudoalteromonas sp. J010]
MNITSRFILTLIIVGMTFACLWGEPPKRKAPAHSRFIKVTSDMQPLSAWQGPWHCVYDKKLNLIWEVKRDDESIHDGYWSYSWYDGNTGIADQGDCYFEASRCDSQDLIRNTNRAALCGSTMWRLPTPAELRSLIQTPNSPGSPHIASDFFPHIKNGDYWSNAADAQLPRAFRGKKRGAVAVNFHTKESLSLPYDNAAFVMLVATPPIQLSTALSGNEPITLN